MNIYYTIRELIDPTGPTGEESNGTNINNIDSITGPTGPTGPTGEESNGTNNEYIDSMTGTTGMGEEEPTVGYTPPPLDMSGSPVFEWTIPHIDIGSYDEMKNVILYIHWRYRATVSDTDNIIHTTETYNVLILPPPNTDIFIPLENITKETMINWLESRIDVQKMQYELTMELLQKIKG